MNTTPFTNKYLEVKIPLKDTIINAFEQSEEYSYLVSDLHSAYDNEACSSVCCILTIAFDMVDSSTHFTIETEAAYTNGDTDTSSIYADFERFQQHGKMQTQTACTNRITHASVMNRATV